MSEFQNLQEPWLITSDLGRMQYLFQHLAAKDRVVQAVEADGTWIISHSDQGHRLIPLWPDFDSARAALGPEKDGRRYREMNGHELRHDVLDQLYGDELIAVFPGKGQSYEMLTEKEFQEAWQFAESRRSSGESGMTLRDLFSWFRKRV